MSFLPRWILQFISLRSLFRHTTAQSTGHAPAYLADDRHLAADASACRLRSADTAKCLVVRRPVLCSCRITPEEHTATSFKTVR